jgi:uncharacterized protein YjbI with pentapeptide repeats
MTVYTLDIKNKDSIKQIISVLVEEGLLLGAYLRDADLRWADLRGADLNGANLDGAYLTGANLWRVRITPKQLSQIIIVDE